MELPKRKPNRLKYYDYSTLGCYFVTICTRYRRHLFGTVVSGPRGGVGRDDPGAPCVRLSRYGEIVRKYVEMIPNVYPNVSIDQSVIMPNHIHLIVRIEERETGAPGSSRPTQLLPRIVAALKRFSNQEAGISLWQNSYHDHIIRNKSDYLRIRNYIDTNPFKWWEDCYYTEIEE